MTEDADILTWSLKGLRVTQLRFDYQFHIHMWSLQRDLLISFGTPFKMRSHTGEEHIFDPECSETLSPLLLLLHQPVEIFSATSDGKCVLRFENGLELLGEPHEEYEAWETHGSGDLESASLLCGVGGGSPWGRKKPR